MVSGLLQMHSAKRSPITLVTKCTSVYFTLSLHYMSYILFLLKSLPLFLVEHILKLKLLGMFLTGLLISFKHCF